MKILSTFSVTLYLWEFQRLERKVTFAKSLINKGEHRNLKKKHFLIQMETSIVTLYLWVFQRLGKMFPFAETLINKGEH